MAQPEELDGVFAPVVTPFAADGSPDHGRFIRHCRWLISQNCGLAIFGTNSEANSLSLAERKDLIAAVVEAGIEPRRLLPGTGSSALPDAIELTRQAVRHGAGGVLMLPPFYYKDVGDEGLFRFYSDVIEAVGDERLRVYLYHIPPVARVPISLDLIERLLKAYPVTIAGIKDSSGDWENSKAMLDRFDGFRVFVGSEAFLLRNMQHGGVGCISATANVNPAAINRLWADWSGDSADRLQAELTELRGIVARFPMIPALKATVAHFSGDQAWTRVRPPLVELDGEQRRALGAALEAAGFSMPGLPD